MALCTRCDSKEFEPDLTDDDVVIIGLRERKEKDSKNDEEKASVERKEETEEAQTRQMEIASKYTAPVEAITLIDRCGDQG